MAANKSCIIQLFKSKRSKKEGLIDAESSVYFDIREDQVPIIYRPEYNVRFLGLERLHPFDAGKWGHVYRYLVEAEAICKDSVTIPNEATQQDLLVGHSNEYLNSLKASRNVAVIAEIPPLFFVPNYFVQKSYLQPMRYQTGGTILAGKLALEKGWAINIGGGFHHCSSDKGGGFCPYADISLLVKFLFNHYKDRVKKVMIVDLDAHQGNGHERDFMDNEAVYILDAYNRQIYPLDHRAKSGIRKQVQLLSGVKDEEYLTKVEQSLKNALDEFTPDLLVYNAGTDILEGDSLGCMAITAQGIITRDEIVFKETHSRHIPIVMLTSGGYLKKSARIIADSIINLKNKGLINTNTFTGKL